MKKRFTFHIGPHKTATTFLQVSMMRSLQKVQIGKHDGLHDRADNFFYLAAASQHIREIRNELHLNLFGKTHINSIRACAQDLSNAVLAISQSYDHIALINENFIGPQIGQYDFGHSLYGLNDQNPIINFLQFLKHNLLDHDIELVVASSIRRQDSFINSTFLNLVADGYTLPFNHYYESIQDIRLNWYDFMSSIAEVADLAVFPFELVVDNQTEFLRNFAEIIGYGGEIQAAKEKRESLSKVGLKLALKINRMELKNEDRSKLIRLLKNDLPKDKFGKAKFKQKLNTAFYSKYDDSNKRVFKEYIPQAYQYIYDKYYDPS